MEFLLNVRILQQQAVGAENVGLLLAERGVHLFGQVVKLDQVFEVGQFVDTQGRTRGRGFTGVMRRWNFAGMGRSHGTHEYHRHGGSIGTNMTPGRTLPNIKMSGQYGNETVSMQNLKLARIDVEKNLLMIEGGVPGANQGVVLVRAAVKRRLKNG